MRSRRLVVEGEAWQRGCSECFGHISGTGESTWRRRCPLKQLRGEHVNQVGLHQSNVGLAAVVGQCRADGVRTLEGSRDP